MRSQYISGAAAVWEWEKELEKKNPEWVIWVLLMKINILVNECSRMPEVILQFVL